MDASIPATLRRCGPEARAKLVATLPPGAVRALNAHFPEWAHGGQLAPAGDDWRTWVVMAGRGFGKTRAGAEWVMGLVRCSAPLGTGAAERGVARSLLARRRGPTPHPARAGRESPSPARGEGGADAPSPACGRGVKIALVAASLDEARRVMVEGPSGILAVARPGEVLEWSFQRRRIRFAGGAEATLFSGAHPDGLRGPEHDFAWCDELAKWRHAREAWDNLQLGLRRGTAPRALVTTTPRRGAALAALLGEAGVVRTGGGSAANPHLPHGWVETQAARLPGILRRQELDGELIEEVAGALWPRALIEACRVAPFRVAGGAVHLDTTDPHPPTRCASGPLPLPQAGEGFLVRVVVGVDPPASEMGDACGIVVCGLGADGVGYVLADASAGGLSPDGWARKVAATAATWGAGLVVAEANNGGDMIKAVLRHADPALPVRLVHARASKGSRAADVAALFENGCARLAGYFPALEDELAGLSYDGPYEGPGRSPDRADAMVWAMRAVMESAGRLPGVRSL